MKQTSKQKYKRTFGNTVCWASGIAPGEASGEAREAG
jgi:hypothetical protein